MTVVWARCSFNWMGSPQMRTLIPRRMRLFCINTGVNYIWMSILRLFRFWLGLGFRRLRFWLGRLYRDRLRFWAGLAFRRLWFGCMRLYRNWLGLWTRLTCRRLWFRCVRLYRHWLRLWTGLAFRRLGLWARLALSWLGLWGVLVRKFWLGYRWGCLWRSGGGRFRLTLPVLKSLVSICFPVFLSFLKLLPVGRLFLFEALRCRHTFAERVLLVIVRVVRVLLHTVMLAIFVLRAIVLMLVLSSRVGYIEVSSVFLMRWIR